MSELPPPWVWDGLPAQDYAQEWRELADWVDWLEQAYQPWVRLPACWPAHEGLKVELSMFWYWHRWLSTAAVNPIDGVRWHSELRHAAVAWRELATCQHEPPVRHHEQVLAARRDRRDQFLTSILERSS